MLRAGLDPPDRSIADHIAQHAPGLGRVSVTCGKAQVARSGTVTFRAIALWTPARLSLSTLAFWTRSFRARRAQPILDKTERADSPRDPFRPCLFGTSPSARSRLSGGNARVVLRLMLHFGQDLVPAADPDRFTAPCRQLLKSSRRLSKGRGSSPLSKSWRGGGWPNRDSPVSGQGFPTCVGKSQHVKTPEATFVEQLRRSEVVREGLQSCVSETSRA